MQKLALMMAVMILGMSPVHGCGTGIDLGSQETGGQAAVAFAPSTWSGSDERALMTEERISSAAWGGSLRVEPGGFPVVRNLQQSQIGIKGLAKVKNEALRAGQDSRPKREAAKKATEALKKGADATRGRGRRKGRTYQRAGIRN
jgi:hypothetical protein